MNYDEIPAGPELDALVAEHVMGLEYRKEKAFARPDGWFPKEHPEACPRLDDPDFHEHFGKHPATCPPYSTDIAAAWTVVEKLKNFQLDEHGDETLRLIYQPDFKDHPWNFCFGDSDNAAVADTAPLAISRAALKAVRALG